MPNTELLTKPTRRERLGVARFSRYERLSPRILCAAMHLCTAPDPLSRLQTLKDNKRTPRPFVLAMRGKSQPGPIHDQISALLPGVDTAVLYISEEPTGDPTHGFAIERTITGLWVPTKGRINVINTFARLGVLMRFKGRDAEAWATTPPDLERVAGRGTASASALGVIESDYDLRRLISHAYIMLTATCKMSRGARIQVRLKSGSAANFKVDPTGDGAGDGWVEPYTVTLTKELPYKADSGVVPKITVWGDLKTPNQHTGKELPPIWALTQVSQSFIKAELSDDNDDIAHRLASIGALMFADQLAPMFAVVRGGTEQVVIPHYRPDPANKKYSELVCAVVDERPVTRTGIPKIIIDESGTLRPNGPFLSLLRAHMVLRLGMGYKSHSAERRRYRAYDVLRWFAPEPLHKIPYTFIESLYKDAGIRLSQPVKNVIYELGEDKVVL